MLKLRRATVIEAGPADAPEQSLTVSLQPGGERSAEPGVARSAEPGARRAAIADVGLVGVCETGDEVLVNVQALDLELGSGGFDVVHANLTRGLDGEGETGAHVMKLNYTSLQHAVLPVEEGERELRLPLGEPVAVLALHGQLAPLAWAFSQAAPGRRLGFVQTPGGALPGGHSRVVRELRERKLLGGHLTAGAAYGGEGEAITTAGALHHGMATLGWDAAVCGPGPGIVGSGSALGHGGLHALDCAHAALALGAPTLVAARMSCSDRRPRHQGISHHTLTVLRLLLAPVVVALPEGGGEDAPADPEGVGGGAPSARLGEVGDADASAQLGRHDWRTFVVDLEGYAHSGLPAQTMGRALQDDPIFFASALAAGAALAAMR